MFGRLTVAGFARRESHVSPSGTRYRSYFVHVRCECGTKKILSKRGLLAGLVKSCGCLGSEITASRNFRHGHSRSPTHMVWCSMKRRCLSPTDKGFKNYGERGIQVCSRWMKFENFHADMGDKPRGLSLERKDNSRGYEPGNCEWATPSVQANNKRNNVVITRGGETRTAATWAKTLGIHPTTIYARVRRGITGPSALDKPKEKLC